MCKSRLWKLKDMKNIYAEGKRAKLKKSVDANILEELRRIMTEISAKKK